MRRFIAMGVVFLLAISVFGQTFGEFKVSGFIDDTLMVKFDGDSPGTTSIFGWSTNHEKGPSEGLWGTLFWKVVPDSTDSLLQSACSLRVEEVDVLADICTVYTAINDTNVDTIVTSGVVGDTVFSGHKIAFAPDPANGYRAIFHGHTSCSTAMFSTGHLWFHIRKAIKVTR